MMKDPGHGYLNLLIMNFIPLLFVLILLRLWWVSLNSSFFSLVPCNTHRLATRRFVRGVPLHQRLVKL